MLGYLDNKINYEIMKYDDAKKVLKEDGIVKEIQVYDLIIRAEKMNNTNGLIIKGIDEKVLNMIIDEINNYTFSEVLKYLKDKKISYQNIEFV